MKPIVTDPRNASPFSWAVDSIRQQAKDTKSASTTQQEVSVPASSSVSVAHKMGHTPSGASVISGPASAVSSITVDEYYVNITNSSSSDITIKISVIP